MESTNAMPVHVQTKKQEDRIPLAPYSLWAMHLLQKEKSLRMGYPIKARTRSQQNRMVYYFDLRRIKRTDRNDQRRARKSPEQTARSTILQKTAKEARQAVPQFFQNKTLLRRRVRRKVHAPALPLNSFWYASRFEEVSP